MAPSVLAQSNAGQFDAPKGFLRKVEFRKVMDRYAAAFHSVDNAELPTPFQIRVNPNPSRAHVRVVLPSIHPDVAFFRKGLGEEVSVFRSFIAPILDNQIVTNSPRIDYSRLSVRETFAAEYIDDTLAFEGLLPTLVRTLGILGAESLVVTGTETKQRLVRLGFPVDLLEHFVRVKDGARGLLPILQSIRMDDFNGREDAIRKSLLKEFEFSFSPSYPDFQLVDESGSRPMRAMRMQVGVGGYVGGIVPGGAIDIIRQVVRASAGSQFIISMPSNIVEPMTLLAKNEWNLSQDAKVTFVSESQTTLSWARDNSLAGTTKAAGSGVETPVVLAPRYTTKGEADVIFTPPESFLMDGLRNTGLQVRQSSLVFQGGNFLTVTDPVSKKRILLVSETEIYRNTSLGLTKEQVMEAFKAELGADICISFPCGSYHLDYDISLRTQGNRVIAFVNDPNMVTKLILRRGIQALAERQLLQAGTFPGLLTGSGNKLPTVELMKLCKFVASQRGSDKKYKPEFVSSFKASARDDAGLNVQLFLASLDFLASRIMASDSSVNDELSIRYLAALRELENTLYTQISLLEEMGWKIVHLPSMPDLFRSLNYVNVLHDGNRILLPSMGNFYSDIDEVAVAAYQAALGEGVQIIPIRTQALQGKNGGVHCSVSAFPVPF